MRRTEGVYMRHRSQLRILTGGLAAIAVVALLAGCSSKAFTIRDRKVCKDIDATGNAVEPTTSFTTADSKACVWFEYANAAAGQVVKVKFKHTESGTESTEEVQTKLTAGSGRAAAELRGLDGGTLAAGSYNVELTNEADVAYGAPMTFNVTSAE